MKIDARIAIAGLALFAAGTAAQIPADFSEAQQVRYQSLLKELRCLVCQNQTLAESNAELAGELRERVAEMIRQGADDEAIFAFMTERYGDFVRYRPPLEPRTYPLWALPVLLLAVLLAALLRFIVVQSRRSSAARKQGGEDE